MNLRPLLTLLLFGAAQAADDVVLFDFETPLQDVENAERIRCVAEHATQGDKAGMVVLDQPFAPNFFVAANRNHGPDWARRDQFALDVFVTGGPVAVSGFIRDAGGQGWWERHNFDLQLQPGKRRIVFPIAALKRQNAKGMLDPASIDFIALTFAAADPAAPPTIHLDHGRLTDGTGGSTARVLFSFEGADVGERTVEDYPEKTSNPSLATVVAEHATDGGSALRLTSRGPAGNVRFSGFDGDWSDFDALVIDVFNPQAGPVAIGGWIRAIDPAAGWWDRHNWERVLRPGMNSVRLALGGMATGNGGPNIDVKRVVGFNLCVGDATIDIDHVRLVQGIEEIAVDGLRRFDFGPADSAAMPGFTKATRDDAFAPARGWGWQPRGVFGRDFDVMEMLGRHRPIDDLCRDFSMPIDATFSVAVPNGDYVVWLMLAPPGAGWGQAFRQRTVTAEGVVVVDQRFDAASFRAHEYRFEDSEDLPGDDLWARYIQPLFKAEMFAVTVDDGRLDLAFDAHGEWWSQQLNGLALWPRAADDAGRRWVDGVDAQRKEQWQANHVERLAPAAAPYAPTAAETARGYARFVHTPDREVTTTGAPTATEVARDAIVMRAAPGQRETGCLGIHALRGLGALRVAADELKGPGGAVIPAAAIDARVVRYKSLNFTATYTPTAKYLDAVPTKGVELRPGVLRSFWFTVRVPEGAAPGDYRGRIRLSLDGGGSDDVDLRLSVLPIALDEPAIPLGIFNMGPMVDWAALEPGGEAYWAAVRELCDDAREHGLTSLDPAIGLRLQRIENGKAVVDFAAMDRFMAIARAAGFTHELNGYAIDIGFTMRPRASDADYQAEAARFGAADFASLVRAYFDAVREHATAENWLPICFCLDDEYLVHPGGDPERLAAFFTLFQDNAPGFHFTAYDSVMDWKDERAPAIERMLGRIDTWGAGLHSPREAELAKRSGKRLWLYNTGMDRFTFGTYLAFAHQHHGVSGFFQWTYHGTGTFGHYYFASHNESHYGVVYPSSHGLRATPVWERISAGCTDHRYLATAARLIGEAKQDGRGAAPAAALEAVIETAFAALRFGNDRVDLALAGEGRADNPMTPESMAALRDALADGIIAIQRARGK